MIYTKDRLQQFSKSSINETIFWHNIFAWISMFSMIEWNTRTKLIINIPNNLTKTIFYCRYNPSYHNHNFCLNISKTKYNSWKNKVYLVTYVYPFIKYGTRKKYKCTDKQKSKGDMIVLLIYCGSTM